MNFSGILRIYETGTIANISRMPRNQEYHRTMVVVHGGRTII